MTLNDSLSDNVCIDQSLKQLSRCFECILLIVTVKIIPAYKSTRAFSFVVFTFLTASSTHQINISPLVLLIVLDDCAL